MEKRLLIVDNDLDLLEILEEVFTDEGFHVITLTDTNDIILEINNHQPDIILMDYILNGINGGELCHQVKSHEPSSHIPVILFSAYSKVIDSLGYYGCDNFIAKPFDLINLVNNVNGFLKQTA